jgi:hypothetical protein
MNKILKRNEFLWTCCGGLAASRSLFGGQWIALVQGSTFAGWHKRGAAEWRVENGVITGRQGPEWGAGDIYTDQEWTDFELEAEWKVRWPANSGIWFRRTASSPGYQIDLLDQPSYPGVLSGSIVRMGKGFIAENRDATSVHRDSWNKVRLRVEGDRISVTQNDKLVVDIRDNTFSAGSLGIEVHGGKAFEGMEVSLRNLRARALP